MLQYPSNRAQLTAPELRWMQSVRFRFGAFGLHVACSATVLALVWGGLYAGWYRWPGWYLTGVTHVIVVMGAVDLALGPTLTLIVASPRKSRKELTRDIGAIVAVQLAALIYGTFTLWHGRPLFYAFSVDRLQLVQAYDLDAGEIALARRQNPSFVPTWYSLPRWVWAPLPKDPKEAQKIVSGSIFGGKDVIQMPRYFRPWRQGLPELRKQLKRIDDLRAFSQPERRSLKEQMLRRGFATNRLNTTFLTGRDNTALVVFDPVSMRIRAILRAD